MEELERERILARCMRWFAEPGSTLPADLACAWLHRHPAPPQQALAVRIEMEDDEGNVIVYDDKKRGREEEEEPAKRRRVIHALYQELFASPLTQRAHWSELLVRDTKGRIVDMLLDVAEADAPMTQLFTALAMQFVARDERRAAAGALLRHPATRPSFNSITQLIAERSSPALFAWALWLYTGALTPAGFLTTQQLTAVAYFVVKYDAPEYLDVLLLGFPFDVTYTRRIYRGLLDVIIPLALVKARYVGWTQCRVLARIMAWPDGLSRIGLFNDPPRTLFLPAEVGAAIRSSDWTIHMESGPVFEWYASHPFTDDLDLNTHPVRPSDSGIPASGIDWLVSSGILDATLITVSENQVYAFLAAVRLDHVDKIARVIDYIGVKEDEIRAMYMELIVLDGSGLEPRAYVELLEPVAAAFPAPFLDIFGKFVTTSVFNNAFSVATAQALLERFANLYEKTSRKRILYLPSMWSRAALLVDSADNIDALFYLLAHVMQENPTTALVDLFKFAHGRLAPAVDVAVAAFIASRPEKIAWKRVLTVVRAVIHIEGEREVLSLPLTVDAVRERIKQM